jgi:Lrp/AsnC family transcriptional regulator, leucine-responsive regulatory protein
MPTNRRPESQTNEAALLDDTDLRLLEELQADARLSLAELGRRVALSPPAVGERLARLEQERVIVGYHTTLNPRALGLSLTAVIRARPTPRQVHQVAELAQLSPEVVDCRRITGEDCYVMTAHVRSVEHLEEVIDRFAVYAQTTTSVVQSAPVAHRGIALSEVPAAAQRT